MDCKQTDEEVVIKGETQSDNVIALECLEIALECLEIAQKIALECLDISDNDCPNSDQQSGNQCLEMVAEEGIEGTEQLKTFETTSDPNVCCNESSEDNSSDSSESSFNVIIKTNESTVEDKEDIESNDNEVIDEIEAKEVNQSDSCEHSCEMSKTDTNYVNTVLDKPSVSRYPLRHRWQLWFWKAESGHKLVWHSALQRVCKPFETIEEFWRLYHHIVCVTQLVPPSDYCVFKEGIEPMWEDRHNINGGKWSIEFTKGANREPNPLLDDIWLEVLLCLIGEGFNEFSEEICGAVVNIRSKEDRISVWTANSNKSVANLKIGEILKLRTGYEGKLKYEAHSTSQRIAQEKDRHFDTNRLNIRANPKSKPIRRSCVF